MPEIRSKLRQRSSRGGRWTDFETELFNLITTKADRKVGLFSRRLYIAECMLEAFDKAVDEFEQRKPVPPAWS